MQNKNCVLQIDVDLKLFSYILVCEGFMSGEEPDLGQPSFEDGVNNYYEEN